MVGGATVTVGGAAAAAAAAAPATETSESESPRRPGRRPGRHGLRLRFRGSGLQVTQSRATEFGRRDTLTRKSD